MKKFVALLLILPFLFLPLFTFAFTPEVEAKAALLMEKETGAILFEENSHEPLEPASVTKVMTLLLIMEALDDGRIHKNDLVITSANAANMGGSQVFLKEGESMSVTDMVKAIAVASGNDASVAMAEHLYGSERSFVSQMNARALELGMQDTTFQNCTGLPAEGHVSSAYDIALMSRELILHHLAIKEYTTIWMDTLRNGEFQLANTNKLIYYYSGSTGLKTGSTDTALYCISATAMRDDMELIAVVLGSPTSAARFEYAKALFNHGFGGFTLQTVQPDEVIPPVPVTLGVKSSTQPIFSKESKVLTAKGDSNNISTHLSVLDQIEAPVSKGQELGEMVVSVNGIEYETIPLIASEAIPRLSLLQMYQNIINHLFLNP